MTYFVSELDSAAPSISCVLCKSSVGGVFVHSDELKASDRCEHCTLTRNTSMKLIECYGQVYLLN